MQVNPEMLILAREAEGHSVRELADKLGLNHSTLSRYEGGQISVPEALIAQLAGILNRPERYFYRPGKIYSASGLYHRKRSRIAARELSRIHAVVNELRLQAAALLEYAHVDSDNEFFRLDYKGDPEWAAKELRRVWQIPSGPIRNVVQAIESAGGVVFRCGFRSLSVDGISQWPLDDDDMPPVFFVNEAIPGDRERFTLCHELAHVVLHHVPALDPEPEADRFASEFLMPANEIKPELGRLTIEKAADLKIRWKVSMQAIIRRARDLQVISQDRYTGLMKRMSALGYRKCEPIPTVAEEPELFAAMVDLSRGHFGHTDEQLIDLLCIKAEDFFARHGRGRSALRLVV